MIDVDYFKSYNDIFGYVVGDEVLCQVVGVICEGCSCFLDLVVWYGGEEFVMVFLGILLGGVWLLVEKVWCMVESLQISYDQLCLGLYLIVSIGVSILVLGGGG